MLVILFIRIVRNYRLGRSVCGGYWSRFLRHMMLFLWSTSTPVGKGNVMRFDDIPSRCMLIL